MLYNLYILLHVACANMDVGPCVQVLSVSKLNRVSRRSAGRVVNSVHMCVGASHLADRPRSCYSLWGNIPSKPNPRPLPTAAKHRCRNFNGSADFPRDGKEETIGHAFCASCHHLPCLKTNFRCPLFSFFFLPLAASNDFHAYLMRLPSPCHLPQGPFTSRYITLSS